MTHLADTRSEMRSTAEFPVMGTHAHLIVDGIDSAALVEAGRDRIHQLDARWSRFRLDSEISRWNASQGRPFSPSSETWDLVSSARAAHRLTDGRFDPTQLKALRDLGYDRSFDKVRASTEEAGHEPSSALPPRLDSATGTIELDPDVEFDPGGIGKGFAADLVTRELIEAGASRVVVNLGGDVRVRQRFDSSLSSIDPLDVAVREPAWAADPVAMVRLGEGALATSTTLRRRWIGPEGDRHHILDPETGQPTTSDAVLASVVAADGWWAEAAATALIVDPHADLPNCAALVLFHNGTSRTLGDFDRYRVAT